MKGKNCPPWVWPESCKGESFFFGDLQPVGGMGEQDAGAVAVYVRVSQDAPEVVVIGRIPIMHTDDLQCRQRSLFHYSEPECLSPRRRPDISWNR